MLSMCDRVRQERACRICLRSCNSEDPTDNTKRIRWMKINQNRIDPESQEIVLKARVDHYCGKVFCL